MLSQFGLIEIKSKSIQVGDIFDRLTVIAVGKKDIRRGGFAVCKCSCGSDYTIVRFDALNKGVSTSCGCYHKEQRTTHGLTSSVHYGRWRLMIDRCNNPESPAYKDYGGRGIKVCDRWHDVSLFINDLPDGYEPELEMDRIDNNGNYEPGNIKWSTPSENGNNKRNNVNLTFNGQTKSITKWAKEYNINPVTLKSRIDDSGFSIEEALTTPLITASERMKKTCEKRWEGHVKKEKQPKTDRKIRTFLYDGKEVTIKQLSDITGLSSKLLSKRLCERGWPIEKAILPNMKDK